MIVDRHPAAAMDSSRMLIRKCPVHPRLEPGEGSASCDLISYVHFYTTILIPIQGLDMVGTIFASHFVEGTQQQRTKEKISNNSWLPSLLILCID
jgi:hypothetical protein